MMEARIAHASAPRVDPANSAFRRPKNGDVTKIWTGTHDSDQRNARHYVVDLLSGNKTLQADTTTATVWPVRTVREKYWL